MFTVTTVYSNTDKHINWLSWTTHQGSTILSRNTNTYIHPYMLRMYVHTSIHIYTMEDDKKRAALGSCAYRKKPPATEGADTVHRICFRAKWCCFLWSISCRERLYLCSPYVWSPVIRQAKILTCTTSLLFLQLHFRSLNDQAYIAW